MLPKCIFDPNQPQQSMSLANLRNNLRALFQCDLMPLRPRASMVLDEFEYATDGAAQAEWSGAGVTVSKTTTKHEGSYALLAEIDATNDRKLSRMQGLNLSAFKEIKFWERCSEESSEIQLYVKDGDGNESYWDITTNANINTWQQDTLDLTTPDSNNGTDADLSDIIEWGFTVLDADTDYIFDQVEAICGLNVAVEGGLLSEYYQQVYQGLTRIDFAGGPSPEIDLPSANPRIDLLVLNPTTQLPEWIEGEEDSSPEEPDLPTDKIPICLVYCKVGMVQIVNYEDKDANPDEGYILKDIRPFLVSGAAPEILSGLDASKPEIYVINRLYWATDTNKLYIDTGSAWTDITALFAGFVRLTGNQSIAGVKTFASKITGSIDGNCDGNAGTVTNGVYNTGDQTIAGIKTFTSIPVGPASNPTTDNQLARKAFTDTKLSKTTAGEINAMAEKTSLAADDLFIIEDSADNFAKKKAKKSNFAASNSQLFTSSGTFTAPVGISTIWVTAIAGGGGGGGGRNAYGGGGGGGSGAYVIKTQLPVVASTGYAITINSGGTGGAEAQNGSNGGSAVIAFNGGTVTLNPGLGGAFGSSTGGAAGGSGGTANSASGGAADGGTGGIAGVIPSTAGNVGGRGGSGDNGGGGGGASSPFGLGSAGANHLADSTNAAGYGAGGGGGAEDGATSRVGGSGKNGCVLVEW
jgi:hypothetical protein